MTNRRLNDAEAHQFALMLLAGAPVSVACSYFLPPDAGEEDIEIAAEVWPGQKEVLKAIQTLTGGVPWHHLSPEERIRIALDKMYAEMAYFLWSHNYSDAGGVEKLKADTCRQALEAKVAGTAGKGNAIEEYYREILQQKRTGIEVKVGKA